MKFLVNPPEKGEKMASRSKAARSRARGKNGRFLKGGKSRTTTARRKNPAKRKAKSRARRSYRARRRSNPPMGLRGFPGMLADGAIGAVTLTASKVATRAVPELLKMDRTSNVGLGVGLASAVVFGWLADLLVGPRWGTWVLAGALTGPLEDAAVRWDVPYVADKLTPGAGTSGTVGIYARARSVPLPGRNYGVTAVRAPAPTARRLPAPRKGGVGDWMTPFIGAGAGMDA